MMVEKFTIRFAYWREFFWVEPACCEEWRPLYVARGPSSGRETPDISEFTLRASLYASRAVESVSTSNSLWSTGFISSQHGVRVVWGGVKGRVGVDIASYETR